MAQLDVFIAKMLTENATEMEFESDKAAILRMSDGEVWPARAPISAVELLNLVAEVIPPALKSSFPQDGYAEFAIGIGSSRVAVHFEKRGGKIKMNIRPDADGSHAPWPRMFRVNDEMISAFAQLLSHTGAPSRMAA